MADLKISFTIEDVPEEYLDEDGGCDWYIKEMVKEIGEGLGATTSYLTIEEW